MITVNYVKLQDQDIFINLFTTRYRASFTNNEISHLLEIQKLLRLIYNEKPFEEEKKPPLIATKILAKVKNDRLRRATDSLHLYSVKIIDQSDEKISAFIVNGDEKEYGIVLMDDQIFCSCPDSMYRKLICKHAVIVALTAIRQ